MGTDSSASLRSEAERLFAEVLLAPELERDRHLVDLCRKRPDLASELSGMHGDWKRLRSMERAGLPSTPMQRSLDTTASGRMIEHFECVSLLGRGGMGEVWRARDKELNREVALKLLPGGMLAQDSARERFRREALAAGRVAHPGITTVYAAGESDGLAWIAQEIVSGGRTMRDWIEDVRRSPEVPANHEQLVAERIALVADALESAHRAGIIHRDIKPQNILLTAEGLPKVADFGLARLEGESALSRTGEFLGTWAYASPEHLDSKHGPVSAASDVFSLGVTMYECLTLQRPFLGDSRQEISRAIVQDEPVAPHLLRRRIRPDLAQVCLKALAKQPSKRYQSMGELRDDLRRYLRREPVLARAPGAREKLLHWVAKHPAASTAIALGSAALVIVSALLFQTIGALADTRAANKQAQEAQLVALSERDVSNDVVQVLEEIFTSADPAKFGSTEPTFRDLIERGLRRLDQGNFRSPLARARVQLSLAGVTSGLGDWPKAHELLSSALETYTQAGQGAEPAAVSMRVQLLNVCVSSNRFEEAEALGPPLLELARAGEMPAHMVTLVLSDMARVHMRAGRLEQARALFEEELNLLASANGNDSIQAAFVRSHLAGVDFQSGNFEQALTQTAGDLLRLEPLRDAGNPVALDVFNTRGMCLQALGRLEEAEAEYLSCLAAAASKLGLSHPRTLNLRINVGTLLAARGLLAPAGEFLREAVRDAQVSVGTQSREWLTAMNNLCGILLQQDRAQEAADLAGVMLDEIVRDRGRDDIDAQRVGLTLAVAWIEQGRVAEALGLAQCALDAFPEGTREHDFAQQILARYGSSAKTPPASASER